MLQQDWKQLWLSFPCIQTQRAARLRGREPLYAAVAPPLAATNKTAYACPQPKHCSPYQDAMAKPPSENNHLLKIFIKTIYTCTHYHNLMSFYVSRGFFSLKGLVQKFNLCSLLRKKQFQRQFSWNLKNIHHSFTTFA